MDQEGGGDGAATGAANRHARETAQKILDQQEKRGPGDRPYVAGQDTETEEVAPRVDPGAVAGTPTRAERITPDNVDDFMTYHRPDAIQVGQHDQVNEAAIEFARVLLAVVPESPERQLSVRAIQLSRFHAHAAIAHRGRY